MKNWSLIWRTLLYALGMGIPLEILLMLIGVSEGHEVAYLIALPVSYFIAKKQTEKFIAKTAPDLGGHQVSEVAGTIENK